MQIVIEIPKEMKEEIDNGIIHCDGRLRRAVINGIPLPDNHGRLIDADVAKEKMGNLDGMGMIGRCLDEIPTVIESAKGE